MAHDVPADPAEKAAIMREFGRRRAAGEPVSEELQAKHVNATNDKLHDWTRARRADT